MILGSSESLVVEEAELQLAFRISEFGSLGVEGQSLCIVLFHANALFMEHAKPDHGVRMLLLRSP